MRPIFIAVFYLTFTFVTLAQFAHPVKDINLEKYLNLKQTLSSTEENNFVLKAASFLRERNDGESLIYSSWNLESYTHQLWNTSTWENDSSEVYSYNELQLLSEKRLRKWSGAQWIDIYRILHSYDTSQRLDNEREQYYDGNWIDSLKKVYNYNSQGLVSTQITYYWDGSGWENWELLTSTYSNNYLVEQINQVWTGSAWENSQRTTYSYDFNNYNINITFSLWLFGSWINLLQVVLTYNTDGLLTEFRIQMWDFISGWADLSRLVFTYDNNYNIIEGMWQDWDAGSSTWINYSRVTSTYNERNILMSDLMQLWSDNNWINSSKMDYEYDLNLNLIGVITQIWSSGYWFNSTRDLYTYIEITSVEGNGSPVQDFQLSQNYPNPFNPVTTIVYQVTLTGFTSLLVYDISGKEVATLVNEEKSPGKYTITFDASGLSSGVYIYQLRIKDFVTSRKMILIK